MPTSPRSGRCWPPKNWPPGERRSGRAGQPGRYPEALIDPNRRAAAVAWVEISSAAPQMAETMRRCLGQVATFLAPASVVSADGALRIFAHSYCKLAA